MTGFSTPHRHAANKRIFIEELVKSISGKSNDFLVIMKRNNLAYVSIVALCGLNCSSRIERPRGGQRKAPGPFSRAGPSPDQGVLLHPSSAGLLAQAHRRAWVSLGCVRRYSRYCERASCAHQRHILLPGHRLVMQAFDRDGLDQPRLSARGQPVWRQH
jgi:hypothetical protein